MRIELSGMEPKIWGATVTPGAAMRDAVLAGGFTGVVALAAIHSLASLAVGLVGGAFLGVVLHVLPPEPPSGDSRGGRIAIRIVSGTCAGIGSGAVIRWLIVDGSSRSELATAAQWGALAGFAWYLAWGFWETRKLG